MSIWIKWTPEQEQMWNEWLSKCPHCIREMITKYNLSPDRLYRYKNTGRKVTIHSLFEDGTVSVNVLYRFNEESMISPLNERRVFGVDPANLEECEWDGIVENESQDTVTDKHATTEARFTEALEKLNVVVESKLSTKH
jgi:hypothetical protein